MMKINDGTEGWKGLKKGCLIYFNWRDEVDTGSMHAWKCEVRHLKIDSYSDL